MVASDSDAGAESESVDSGDSLRVKAQSSGDSLGVGDESLDDMMDVCRICEQKFGARDRDCPHGSEYNVTSKGGGAQVCEACYYFRTGSFGGGATSIRQGTSKTDKKEQQRGAADGQNFPELLKQQKKLRRILVCKEKEKYNDLFQSYRLVPLGAFCKSKKKGKVLKTDEERKKFVRALGLDFAQNSRKVVRGAPRSDTVFDLDRVSVFPVKLEPNLGFT